MQCIRGFGNYAIYKSMFLLSYLLSLEQLTKSKTKGTKTNASAQHVLPECKIHEGSPMLELCTNFVRNGIVNLLI